MSHRIQRDHVSSKLTLAAALLVACSSGDTTELIGLELEAPAEDTSTAIGDDEFESEQPNPDLDEAYPIFEAYERVKRSFAGTHGEPLPEFAAKCAIATGIELRDFKCSDGTVVPTTNHANGKCDRPNRLNKECDPGSRFQILGKTADAVAVAHCRKMGRSGNLYDDIAIIQYNHVNGATCYYQALGRGDLDGDFKSPALGTSDPDEADQPNPNASRWLSNRTTDGIDCRRCHDNGAIIRSPYLAQLTGANALPGAGDNTYNKTQPVSFIGDDYQDWTLFTASVAGNTCSTCHRMGYSNSPLDQGTSMDLGLRATATSETAKNPHSAASPIWMTPGQITYCRAGESPCPPAASETSAQAVRACAQAGKSGSALPAGCSVAQLSQPFAGLTPAHLPTLF